MADVYQIHGSWQRIKAIYLSQLMPSLKTSNLTCYGISCWKSGIAAEVIGLPTFIGEHLYNAKVALMPIQLFCVDTCVIVLSALWREDRDAVSFMVATRLEKSYHEYRYDKLCYTSGHLLRQKTFINRLMARFVLNDFFLQV